MSLVRTKDIIEAGEKIRWDALVRAAGVHDKARLRGLTEIREFAGCGKMSREWFEGAPSQALDTRFSNEEFESRVAQVSLD